MAKALYSQEMIFNAAVAIDADKNSQFAVKWAVDRLNLNGFITLLHVKTQQNSSPRRSLGLSTNPPRSTFHPFCLYGITRGLYA